MDDARFDAITRVLSGERSRRGVTPLLGGVALGMAAAALRFAETGGKKKKKKKPAQPPGPGGCNNGDCTGGRTCPAAECACPPAAPHWCASANTCVPACPTGTTYDPGSCACNCAVTRSCCECRGGASDFCRTDIDNPNSCGCTQGGVSFFAAQASLGMTGVCGGGNRCHVTCAPPSHGTTDACKTGGNCGCGGDLKCFQPLGGGPTRCGKPTVTGSCGCTSHQQCTDNHGIGAFCVAVTGSLCTGCQGSFCATQA